MSDEQYKTPGQLLTALLSDRGWNNRTFATVMSIEEPAASRLIGDKRPITTETALMLEAVFEIPAERFLQLQTTYDLAVARLTALPDPARATRAKLHSQLPISAMIKRGWLDARSVRDTVAIDQALSKFFGADHHSGNVELLPHAAKRSQVSSHATPVQLAWLYRVRQLAGEMLAPKFSPAMGQAAVEKLKMLLSAAEEVRKVPRILAEHGIRFVIVESLPSAKIDGVCLWLNDVSPVIGMSLRFDRIDNFWFVLRHELEHVICGHGKHEAVIDAELDGGSGDSTGDMPEEERIANFAAANFSVPQNKLEAFIARKAPFFAEKDIIGFARTLGVHPGLVAGQLQRRTKKYSLFRIHLAKIRSIVMPGAVVDGWGNVAPTEE